MSDDSRPLHLATAEAVEALAVEMYGRAPISTGVVHVTSAWRKDPETHLTLRIVPQTPRSNHDTFALHLARARADAIVTTGRILRQEKDLTHTLGPPGPLARALAEWRRHRLGKSQPPVSLVLTESGDIDLEHPLFAGPGRVMVFTGKRGQWRLESRAADAGVELVAVEDPDPRSAVELLRRELGAATISIEAGPTVARVFYEPPLVVDEVMLSLFSGESVASSVRGIRQPPPEMLRRLFPRRSEPFEVLTPDGPWTFLRFLR
ncbi:MAG: dihydrofolate reductase family protein [Holophagales bacterium]|nr:dihydrofolate reductase family protein [Holophagales bacterium]